MATGLAGISGVRVQSRAQMAQSRGQDHVIIQLHNMVEITAREMKMKRTRALLASTVQVCMIFHNIIQQKISRKEVFFQSSNQVYHTIVRVIF